MRQKNASVHLACDHKSGERWRWGKFVGNGRESGGHAAGLDGVVFGVDNVLVQLLDDIGWLAGFHGLWPCMDCFFRCSVKFKRAGRQSWVFRGFGRLQQMVPDLLEGDGQNARGKNPGKGAQGAIGWVDGTCLFFVHFMISSASLRLSVEKFMEMVNNPEYQAAVIHRSSALLDSRLIAILEKGKRLFVDE